MSRFLLRRLLGAIPTLFGISLVTFIILNLSMSSPRAVYVGSAGVFNMPVGTVLDDRTRFPDQHLPLFINLSIADARTHARVEIERLKDPKTATRAGRVLAHMGGAWLPYLIPALETMSKEQKERALDALDRMAPRLGLERHLRDTPDRAAFWKRYWATYGSDYKPVRSVRLTRRFVKREDRLVRSELMSLDTYALPQLIDALEEDLPPETEARVVSVIVAITGIEDPLTPNATPVQRSTVLRRWREWWFQRYDKYTTFEGVDRVTGMITETRYFRWLGRIFTLDFGVSSRDGRPILEKLMEKLPTTLLLTILGLILAYGLAIPIGVISAVRRGGIFDRTMMVLFFVLYSLPTFWLAMLLLRFLGGTGHLDLFPAQGLATPLSEHWTLSERFLDRATHLVLPVFCLASVSLAMLTRYQRVGMIKVINLDFIRAAQAKGLGRTEAIFKHGLRNGVIPVITMLGLQIPYLVSGSVVIERIFGIPGMGDETFEAILSQDQPWLMATVTVTAVMTMIGVIAADALYALIDPRIAPGGSGKRQ